MKKLIRNFKAHFLVGFNKLLNNTFMKNDARFYKTMFLIFFDGGYEIDSAPNTFNTFQMGVCKLEYIERERKLIVHLRRPGLLIGKKGKTIDALEKHLGIKVGIEEVDLKKL